MHKICYGIIAFEKPEHIKRKIEALYTEEDFFIVHWNKNSSKQDFLKLKEMFKDYSNVYIHSKHRVYWGHVSILHANLSNMKKSLQLNLDFDHFICLTQQTYPIKSINYIKNYLSQYKNQSFIYCVEMDLYGGNFTRTCNFMYITSRNPNIHFTDRFRGITRLLTEFVYYFPKILPQTISILKNVKRDYPFKKISIKYLILLPYRFMSSSLYTIDWGWSRFSTDMLTPTYHDNRYLFMRTPGPDICLTKKHISYVLTDKKAKKLLKNVAWAFAPEEFYIETVLYYSPFYQTECITDKDCMSMAPHYNLQSDYDYSCLIDPEKFIIHTSLPRLGPSIYTFDNTLFTRKIKDEAVMDLLDEYITRS